MNMTTRLIMNWKNQMQAYDERRDIAIPGDLPATIQYSVDQFLSIAATAIERKGVFTVALSGGSTPKAIYERLAAKENRKRIDWSKVQLFWSDERYVPHDHPESNYLMAMEAGFSKLPIPSQNIFPIPIIDEAWDESAKIYEELILMNIPSKQFDLVMLGMGEDGHTASLFPKTHGLHPNKRLVIANYIPQKDCWRITLTFDCINSAHHISIYALGKSKASMIKRVLNNPYDPDTLPVQRIGTDSHKALWILDKDAASLILPN